MFTLKTRSRATGWPVAAVAVMATLGIVAGEAEAQNLKTVQIASGLRSPLFVGTAPGDTERLFILEQNDGQIHIWRDGTVEPTPFLDVKSKIDSGGEQGLLGLAFHPDYQNNGFFFINYTNTSGDTVVERYSVSGDPDIADPNSGQIVLTIDQPFSNHNGGNMQFGPLDGYLYIGMGDGGSANDPGNRAQDGNSLLGKMLRLDVDALPYQIPSDNPFVNDPNVRDEIWALGLRNPWRWDFDDGTGDLYIGDVGQNQWEEIDFQPADAGGENYGWRCMEGNHCTGLSGCECFASSLTDPIYEYQHSFNPVRCSVTGGVVYRGESIPLLRGTYFFADYCSNEIWTFRYDGNEVSEFQERTDELNSLAIGDIVHFGEDWNGEIHIVSLGGEIYRVETVMQLAATPLVGGQAATLGVRGATANATVYFAYSITGVGATPIPQLGVVAALSNPVLVGSDQANGNGIATITRMVPEIATGRQVWFQAAEQGNTSNVVSDVVQ